MSDLETVDGRSQRRERNAALLFDAAIELLNTRSFAELTVEEISQHAGVGRATFFRIYETKAGLLREFNRRLAADAAARIAAAGDIDLYQALGHVRGAIAEAWRDAGPGVAGMAREFTSSSQSSDLHSPHPELLALVERLIRSAMDTGEVPRGVPADLAASLALVHLAIPIAYVLDGNPADTEVLGRTLLDQWYAGMTAEAVHRPAPQRRRR